MELILLTTIIGLLTYLNYQVYKNWTEPRLKHETLEMKKIYNQWEKLANEKNL